MKALVIGALGGVAKKEHHKAIAARDNYEVLYNQYRDRASALEHNLEKMEEQFLRASAQAEQLLERLRYTEQQLANKEEERANASAGWNTELKLKELFIADNKVHKEHNRELRDRLNIEPNGDDEIDRLQHRIAELNTLIAKEGDKPKVEFSVMGGNPAEGHSGSRTPLRLIMTNTQNGVERHVELRSLSYSKANRNILENIMMLANRAVRG